MLFKERKESIKEKKERPSFFTSLIALYPLYINAYKPFLFFKNFLALYIHLFVSLYLFVSLCILYTISYGLLNSRYISYASPYALYLYCVSHASFYFFEYSEGQYIYISLSHGLCPFYFLRVVAGSPRPLAESHFPHGVGSGSDGGGRWAGCLRRDGQIFAPRCCVSVSDSGLDAVPATGSRVCQNVPRNRGK